MIRPELMTVHIHVNENDFKTILDAIEYYATHKFKKDGVSQAMLAELACEIEETSDYEPPFIETMNAIDNIKQAMNEYTFEELDLGGDENG